MKLNFKTSKTQLIYIFFCVVSFHSCSSNNNNETSNSSTNSKPKSVNLNISILLDLSDRIDTTKYPNPTMQYYQRDLGYIKAITTSFEEHALGQKSRFIDDRIQVFVEPAPVDPQVNSWLNDLKIHLTKDNATQKYIKEVGNKYQTIVDKIYKTTIKTNNYPGSDIWGFMKNKVTDYCVKEGYKNILIILTDGYVYHERNKRNKGGKRTYFTHSTIKKDGLNKNANWEEIFNIKKLGLIPANNNLKNLTVLVLGVNPNNENSYEFDIIKKYWSDWLISMGVKNYDIKQAELPTQMEDFIKDFIAN